MASFADLNMNDIIYLLRKYNQPINNLFLDGWNFLIANKNIDVPISIADWIIAYNNPNLEHTTYSTILAGNSETFGNLDKDRIIRIYTYAHKISNDLDTLPHEIITKIISHTDCKTIINLCNTSPSLCYKNLLRSTINIPFNIDNYDDDDIVGLCKFMHSKHKNRLFVERDVVYITDKYGRVFSLTEDLPRFVENFKNIIDLFFISTYRNDIIALNDNGKILVSGFIADNFGLPKVYDISIPRVAPLPEKIKQIAGGIYSLSSLGRIYEYNKKINDKEYIQIAGDRLRLIALDKNGEVFIMRSSEIGDGYNFRKVMGLYDVIMIGGNSFYSLAVQSNGDIMFFGTILYENFSHNLPINIGNIKNVIKICVSEKYSLIITSDGNLYFFGLTKNDKREKLIKKVKKLKINNVIDAACSEYGIIALLRNNTLTTLEEGFNQFANLNFTSLEL